jgi:hypothetical protein
MKITKAKLILIANVAVLVLLVCVSAYAVPGKRTYIGKDTNNYSINNENEENIRDVRTIEIPRIDISEDKDIEGKEAVYALASDITAVENINEESVDKEAVETTETEVISTSTVILDASTKENVVTETEVKTNEIPAESNDTYIIPKTDDVPQAGKYHMLDANGKMVYFD